jgi:hypothetical protein
MGDFRSHLFQDEKQPLFHLLLLFVVALVGGGLLFLLTVVAGNFFFNIDNVFGYNTAIPGGPNERAFMKYILVSQQITLFVLPSLFLMTIINKSRKPWDHDFKSPPVNEVILVILLAFCIFPVTSFTGQLNSQVQLPDWLSGIEKWMVDKEESAEKVIQLVTTPETLSNMVGNIIIIAVLPAFGEELIFRGVLQKILLRVLRSGNASVWITAFIFSSLHLQFFGFLPRFILGLVFGYLFLWSGTLWLPIVAHFVNNAVSVAADYFQSGNPSEVLPDSELWQVMLGIVFPVFAISLIMLYFRHKSIVESGSEHSENEITG